GPVRVSQGGGGAVSVVDGVAGARSVDSSRRVVRSPWEQVREPPRRGGRSAMSLWKRTMDYLGLGPDDAYDDYDDYEVEEPAPRSRRQDVEPRQSRATRDDSASEGVVRTLPSRPTFPSRDFDPSQARRSADDSGVTPRPQRP